MTDPSNISIDANLTEDDDDDENYRFPSGITVDPSTGELSFWTDPTGDAYGEFYSWGFEYAVSAEQLERIIDGVRVDLAKLAASPRAKYRKDGRPVDSIPFKADMDARFDAIAENVASRYRGEAYWFWDGNC